MFEGKHQRIDSGNFPNDGKYIIPEDIIKPLSEVEKHLYTVIGTTGPKVKQMVFVLPKKQKKPKFIIPNS